MQRARRRGLGAGGADAIAVAAWVVLDWLRANAGFLAFPIGTPAQAEVANLTLLQTGRYYVAALIPRGVEMASCWGRSVAFREGGG